MKRGRNQRRRQGMNVNRALDSNGPDVRIRGTANQIYDKYLALARDASSSGDRVKAENYLQHAEHYFRVIRSMQPPQQLQQDSSADADGEQPTVADGNSRAPKRSEKDGDGAAPSGNASDGASAGDRSKQDGEQPDGEERRPRRRRQRRAAREDGEDGGDKAAEEAAESAAS